MNIFLFGSVIAVLRLPLAWPLLFVIAAMLVSSFHVVGDSLVSSTKAAMIYWMEPMVVSASADSARQG